VLTPLAVVTAGEYSDSTTGAGVVSVVSSAVSDPPQAVIPRSFS
jgi:hypothetical protein